MGRSSAALQDRLADKGRDHDRRRHADNIEADNIDKLNPSKSHMAEKHTRTNFIFDFTQHSFTHFHIQIYFNSYCVKLSSLSKSVLFVCFKGDPYMYIIINTNTSFWVISTVQERETTCIVAVRQTTQTSGFDDNNNKMRTVYREESKFKLNFSSYSCYSCIYAVVFMLLVS